MLPDLRRVWTRDLEGRVKELRQGVAALEAELTELRRAHRALALTAWYERRAGLLERLDERLAPEPIRAHVTSAVARADLCTDPTPHLVIDHVLPPDFYELLTSAVPPPELFPDRDPVKQDFEMDALPLAPELTQRVWRFFDRVVVGDILAPALFERFRGAIAERYAETGGPAFGDRAAAIQHRTVAGRIQLRRPGYHLRPHLDPKRVAMTGLVYLARRGDSEAFGTQLFRVSAPFVASGMKTFFPEEAGLTCELARTVPFRPNTLFAFVNARAAHGATLPSDAPLHERYAYQFYVKPDDGLLKKLLRDLPDEARASWGELLA